MQANLQRYIVDEMQHKREAVLDDSDWQRIAPSDIPEQKNGCDCGVFMVKYSDWLVCCASRALAPRPAHSAPAQARQAAFSFSQRDMPYFRSRIVAEVRPRVTALHVAILCCLCASHTASADPGQHGHVNVLPKRVCRAPSACLRNEMQVLLAVLLLAGRGAHAQGAKAGHCERP